VLLFSSSEAQTTIVKRIQYDVPINSGTQNELVSFNNIVASTRLDFLNSLFESVKKGETEVYSLKHVNSVPVYKELKKEAISKQFKGEKLHAIQLRFPPDGDSIDFFYDSIISEN